MRPKRKIDSALGLHGLGQISTFHLTYLTEQCEELIANLDELFIRTNAAAPKRDLNFCLGKDRWKKMHPRSRERRLEYEVLQHACGLASEPVLLGLCQSIHSYQVPLKRHQAPKDINAGWKAIDLVGSDSTHLPVIIELKCDNVAERKGNNETPLRMIVEAAAYGVALKAMWDQTSFRNSWEDTFGVSNLPEKLEKVRLVGLAPKSYWESFSKEIGRGRFQLTGFWSSFSRLCHALEEKGFPVTLASIVFQEAKILRLEVFEIPK